MEQKRYNTSDIRALVLENTLRQSDLLAHKSHIGSEVTHVKDPFNAFENNMASIFKQLENCIASVESDISHYAEKI